MTPARGASVTFQLSSNLELCGTVSGEHPPGELAVAGPHPSTRPPSKLFSTWTVPTRWTRRSWDFPAG